ncbi:outer membrane lipoprotein-sorting protein [Gammaproteobacteria bacterium 45_16_T64]|nr:outer membrane lipoprotein-sorting protein [Gammaproteobacteria bacterium 45_16_T64]
MRKKLFQKTLIASGLLAASIATSPLMAKVDGAQAAKLGGELTDVGAETAGNADGTIPAYTGGLKDAPACYDGGTFLCNPFPDDKPLFEITAANLDQYKDKLSPGQIAMFNTYPDTYKMPVYQTRRTAALPDSVNSASKENASKTFLAEGGNGLKDYTVRGYPFPIPNDGVEAIWNHIVRYRGEAATRLTGQATPQVNGAFNVVIFEDQVAFRFGLTDIKPGEDENVLFYFKQKVKSPARLAGNVLLVHETIDQVKEPRKAWIYNAGQRRVRRAPQVAYDGPGTAADGLRTADNFDMYNGTPDRYEWKLVGKKEMYIPYNNFKLDEKGLKYKDIIKPGHLNPEYTRHELHRVWVVESKLKPRTRHVYGARHFYIDEDTWQAGIIDHYDGRGNLWRVGQAYQMQYYHSKVPWYAMEALYDLNAKRYLALGLDNEEPVGIQFDKRYSKIEYKPAALRQAGVR